MQPISGWYTDPTNPLQERLWDGSVWTNQVRPQAPMFDAQNPRADRTGMSFIGPFGQSKWVVAAGYLGLFSLCFWPLGFFAAVAAYKALSRRRTGIGMLRIITGFVGGAIGICISLLLLVSFIVDL